MVLGASLLTAVSLAPIATISAHTTTGNELNIEQKVQQLSQKINLTEVQKQQVKDIYAKNADEMRNYYQQITHLKKQLTELTFHTDYSKDKAEDLAEDQADIMEKLIVARAEQRHAVWAVLTPEQKAAMKKMAEDRKANMMDDND